MKKINKKKLNELLDKGAALIDMRTPLEFRDTIITGSKNLPLRNFINYLLKHNKKIPIALIVASFEDDASDMVLVNNYAEQIGFEKLHFVEYDKASA